ncbi:MAG TPA: labile enterotoxin output A, partial [Idiomarina loihiensis]|nr:labile enterotoxin output A [Idiomarina loihiensis]
RDGVVSVAKTLGVDIAKYLKFKPYGADKLAKGANGALALLGLAIEAWDSYDRYQREEKFNNSIGELVEGFEKQRRELLELINSDDFKAQFFGNYQALIIQIEELSVQLEKTREQQQRFHDWRAEAESIASQLATKNASEHLGD